LTLRTDGDSENGLDEIDAPRGMVTCVSADAAEKEILTATQRIKMVVLK